MSDCKVIDITPFVKKRKQKEEPPEKEDFKAVMLIDFDKTSCGFQLLFENDKDETLPLDKQKVLETVYRLFEIVQVLSEEFELDI
tara:strand:- start:595 stop:849 length:255 start_codon:yes stop_codon:yes gene_type:complete